MRKKIRTIYNKLEEYFGDLGWWPADSDFEVIIGAILTQNTAWCNVEKAIANLKKEEVLHPAKIVKMCSDTLSRLIHSAGYYRIKARRLKEVSRFIMSECDGKLWKLRKQSTEKLREKLLKVKGVGPETADSILIYAINKPVFVVDIYTKRIFSRHKLIQADASYNDVQSLVHKYFSGDTRTLNQFHALLVETAKRFCRKKSPLCRKCPLGSLL